MGPTASVTRPVVCPSCRADAVIPVAGLEPPSCATCGSRLPWLVEAGDREFASAVAGNGPVVLVDLWAPWCGPCRMVGPVLEQLAAEMAGQLKVVKVNVDESPAVAEAFGVQSIPTMVVVRDGAVVDGVVGALPAAALRQLVQEHLDDGRG